MATVLRTILLKSFILLLLFSVSFQAIAQLPVHDSFETAQLSKIWDTSRLVKGAATIQSNIADSGHNALKIILKKGDKYEAGNDSSKVSERAELSEKKQLFSKEYSSYEYSFAMLIPGDFPIVPTRLVIAQWKQECNKEICSDDSPVLALRYTGGNLQITIQTSAFRKVVYETNTDLRNKWIHFRFQTNFSRIKGYIKAWINDKQVLDYEGKTCYAEDRGYNNNSLIYFKMGLYRDTMPAPMTIYIDDYAKKELPNSL